MQVVLGTLEHVSPRSVWENEARDFTPWLASNLNVLAAALGLDLELIGIEAAVGNYSCDIEALEKNTNRRVVIENQLEQTDHSHLGQLLTYAAGLDAAIVVWISTNVRDEHREAIDFLNRHTRDSVDFFAVALELVKIGDSQPAVVFRLAASPNAWAKTAAAVTRPEITEKMIAYQAFFQPLMDELRETHRFTNARAAQPQSWCTFSGGATGISYGVSFTSKNELRVEFYIDVGDVAKNKAIFDYFCSRKNTIENAVGVPLQWDRLEAKRASRIAAALAETRIEDEATRGVAMRAWTVDKLLKFKQVFGPEVRAAIQLSGQLVDRPSSDPSEIR